MEFLLLLAVLALGLSLRRAFVRLERMERSATVLRELIERLDLERPAADAPLNACVTPDTPPLEESGSTSPAPHVAQAFSVATVAQGSRPAAVAQGSSESNVAQGLGAAADQAGEASAGASLETMIGTQWLLYIGVIAIVIGVAYFEKLAIEKQWIGETARVVQGAVFGLALVYGGTRFGRAGYRLYGQMITGGGAAILYVSIYAAFTFYHLINQSLALGLMVAITGMVAWLAERGGSQGLAVLAVGGGFATPFLMPGRTDAQVALFGYDTILIGGTVLLSRRRDWPVLNIVSYVATLLTVATWADRFYRPEHYLVTELFVTLFCVMFLDILRECRRVRRRQAVATVAVLWTTPAAYYVASLAILMDHSSALLIWLLAMMLVGGILSTRLALPAGLVVWAAVTLPLFAWIQLHMWSGGWLVAGLATVAGVYTIALAAQLYHALERDDAGPFGIIWLHANGLLMFAATYFLLLPNHLGPAGAAGAAFAVWHWVLAAALAGRRRDLALHFTALGFSLMSIAIAVQFDGPVVTVGWAAQGAAIIALGLRERRLWLRIGGHLLFAIAVGRALDLLLAAAPASHVVLFNTRTAAGLFVATLCYLLAWLFYRDRAAPQRALGIGAPLVAAQVVVLTLLTGEINAYWPVREWDFERQVAISVTWGLFAMVLVVVGLRKRYAPIRYFAILVFIVTIAKVFFIDLANLDKVYRVISIIGLGVILLVTSYLYQRARGRGPEGSDDQSR